MNEEREPIEERSDNTNLDNEKPFEIQPSDIPRRFTKNFEEMTSEPGKAIEIPKYEAWVVGKLSHAEIIVPGGASLQVEVAHDCKFRVAPGAKVVVLEESSDYEITQNGVTTMFGKKGNLEMPEQPVANPIEEGIDGNPRIAA
jgi:hypothetical protein